MRIIKCYVASFGPLKDYAMDFDEKMTTIIDENGRGKTTLATFIKAMFYGLAVTTKRKIDENERKKYTPWGQTTFGGTLDFEIEGRSYRISRYFEGKEETFELYSLPSNKLCNDFNSNIGEQLFGIDSEGFERSIYLPQARLSGMANTTISAKLTNLTHDTSDLNNFDSAIKLLDKSRKSYKTPSAGHIVACDNIIKNLSQQIDEASEAVIALNQNTLKVREVESKIAKINAELKVLTLEKEIAVTKSAEKERYEHYLTLKNDITKLENDIANLNAFFKGQVVSEKQCEDMKKLITSVNALSLSLQKSNDLTEEGEKQRLEKFFEKGLPTSEEISKIESLITPVANPSSNKLSSALLLLASIFTLLSLPLFFLNRTAAIITFAIGIILFVAFALFKNTNLFQSKDNKTAFQENKVVEKFLSRYFTSSVNYLSAMNIIKENLSVYNTLNSLLGSSEKRLQEQKNALEEQQNILTNFFSFYFEDATSFEDNLSRLQKGRETLVRLSEEIEEKSERLKKFEGEKAVNINQTEGSELDYESITKKENMLKEELAASIREKASYDSAILRHSASAEGLNDLLILKESEENSLADLKANYEGVVQTIDFLTRAKDELNSRYLKDIEKSFLFYFNSVVEDEFKDAIFDSDLNISFLKEGKAREFDYFSEGYKDIIHLCLRLALIDCLYKEEKPFIIFDDPLVNLDDTKLIKAKKLFREVSSRYQVIHLVCHSSRV